MEARNALMVFAMAFALFGCGLELLTTTAIQGELHAQSAKSAVKQLEFAENTTAKTSIQQAVNIYHAENGAYPNTLDELVPEYLPNIPSKADGSSFGYEPLTGAVTERPAPKPVVRAPTPADLESMNRLRVAIDLYGRNTGYYPPSLPALVPNYIQELPRTESGQAFVYDPQTGTVYHPAHMTPQQDAAGAAQRPAQRGNTGMNVRGGGPLGEVMTGIAIQRQLSNMSNAGAASARNRARQNLDNTINGQDRRTQRYMDDLGL